MKKRIVTFMFALLLSSGMLFANTTAIKCYATAAGCVVGGVASIMVDFPDEETSGLMGGLFFTCGGIFLLTGILFQSLDIDLAKTDSDSPLQYVNFNTNGKDTNLSVKFDY